MCINLLDLTPVQKENNPIVKNYTCIFNKMNSHMEFQ